MDFHPYQLIGSAHIWIVQFLMDRGVPLKPMYYWLKFFDGLGTWIHELSHYVVLQIVRFPCNILSVSWPEVTYWIYIDDDVSEEIKPPETSVVRNSVSVSKLYGFTLTQRILYPLVSLAPAIPITLTFIFLPTFIAILIQILTLGSMFPSTSDLRNVRKVILNEHDSNRTKDNRED